VSGLDDRILDLARALRRAGVPVAVSDDLDALRAAGLVDLLHRPQLREALAATMVKTEGHRQAFDALFDVYFPARPGAGGAEDSEPAGQARDVGDFLAELVARVLAGDEASVRALAVEAVDSYGGVANRDGSTAYFAYRVFRQINLAGVLRRLLGDAGRADDALAERLARDDFELLLRRFRQEVEAELRRRLVLARGAEEVARRSVGQLPEDVDFFRMTSDEQAALRRTIHPLARKLATRLAVRRRHRADGRLDVRRTVRRSLSTGGVPLEPIFRAKHVTRPELVLLCDVSGSVSAFSRFTLTFCHALSGQFSRVRSFAFIDTIDEVTDLFAAGDAGEAVRRLSHEADLVWLDGHSDYGHAFETFHARYLDAVTPRATVLVLGDARNNYRPSKSWVLRELTRRARHTYWLNPEARQLWGSGDSLALDYAACVDGMVECRNLRQLAAFVEALDGPSAGSSPLRRISPA
jgi:uncharacterized protein with von Willebrand factor type A (vWA) domain